MNLDVKVQTLINALKSTSFLEHSDFKLFLSSPFHVILLVLSEMLLKNPRRKTTRSELFESHIYDFWIKEYYWLQVLVLCRYGYTYQTTMMEYLWNEMSCTLSLILSNLENFETVKGLYFREREKEDNQDDMS